MEAQPQPDNAIVHTDEPRSPSPNGFEPTCIYCPLDDSELQKPCTPSSPCPPCLQNPKPNPLTHSLQLLAREYQHYYQPRFVKVFNEELTTCYGLEAHPDFGVDVESRWLFAGEEDCSVAWVGGRSEEELRVWVEGGCCIGEGSEFVWNVGYEDEGEEEEGFGEGGEGWEWEWEWEDIGSLKGVRISVEFQKTLLCWIRGYLVQNSIVAELEDQGNGGIMDNLEQSGSGRAASYMPQEKPHVKNDELPSQQQADSHGEAFDVLFSPRLASEMLDRHGEMDYAGKCTVFTVRSDHPDVQDYRRNITKTAAIVKKSGYLTGHKLLGLGDNSDVATPTLILSVSKGTPNVLKPEDPKALRAQTRLPIEVIETEVFRLDTISILSGMNSSRTVGTGTGGLLLTNGRGSWVIKSNHHVVYTGDLLIRMTGPEKITVFSASTHRINQQVKRLREQAEELVVEVITKEKRGEFEEAGFMK
ncbi:hypothetical protein BJ508DRAFT_329019 [Ascobolus immersus RN42]|uniref:Uncharacterized protein n=1 Tax=Ascobolus immersus RN42 TaxID=1160509 RepID=A0A3N4I3M2_ASCIM|nr:hypothetical protein BJ508DRAFT_329019 [Ascobolus immersus RN42]